MGRFPTEILFLTALLNVLITETLSDPAADWLGEHTDLKRCAYDNPEAGTGITMTSWAFAQAFPWFPALLSLTAVLFAFSTMISWSYYGEQCWAQLFGLRSILAYKLLFLFCVWLGSVIPFPNVLDFSDLMILGMAFPNILGVALLSGKVKVDLDVYLQKLRAGEFQSHK